MTNRMYDISTGGYVKHESLKIKKVAAAVRRAAPHLDFMIWDMAPFIQFMHNWNRNIVFIECEKDLVKGLISKLVDDQTLPPARFYCGISKPKLVSEFQPSDAETIVVLSANVDPKAPRDKELDAVVPPLEERIVDLLYFSYREVIPLSIIDAIDVCRHFIHSKEIDVGKTYRYAERRYVSWLLALILSAEAREGVGIEARYVQNAKRIMQAIREVGVYD